MSTTKRRERDREAMRQRILDAAKRLFAKESYESVSIRRIAAAIEYSPAAIYRYFGSKREIFSVLRDEGFKRFITQQRQRMEEIADPIQRLRAGGKGYVRFALSEPEFFHLMFCTKCGEVDLEGELAENSIESYNLFCQCVRECVETGHFGDVSVETAVFAFWANVHGLAHLINTGRVGVLASNTDIESLLDSVSAFQLRPGSDKDVLKS